MPVCPSCNYNNSVVPGDTRSCRNCGRTIINNVDNTPKKHNYGTTRWNYQGPGSPSRVPGGSYPGHTTSYYSSQPSAYYSGQPAASYPSQPAYYYPGQSSSTTIAGPSGYNTSSGSSSKKDSGSSSSKKDSSSSSSKKKESSSSSSSKKKDDSKDKGKGKK